MRLNKKQLFIDLLILIVPVLIIILLMPVLPEKISIHRGIVNRYIDKKYAFILGFIPFIIYKLKYDRKL
jgi:hypothetical protein